jgi:hypothetical protein
MCLLEGSLVVVMTVTGVIAEHECQHPTSGWIPFVSRHSAALGAS